MSARNRLFLTLLTFSISALFSCGYHVGGKADLLPKTIRTISVPAFRIGATKYQVSDKMAEAISEEFIRHTNYRIEANPSLADAVLNGSINNVFIAPTVYDPRSARSTIVQVVVYISVTLLERTTGRVLYSRPNFESRQSYEIAADPHQFFDEADPAYNRLSRDVARSIVAGIVENF